MILGITGKCCSGKNAAASVFVSLGWKEIDVDLLGHKALEIKKGEVISAFGPDIENPDGSIDRKKLGKIVFGSRKKLKILENILHPEMVRLCREEIAGFPENSDIVINAAILHRMGLHELCDAVLWIKAPFIKRLKRALKRDRHSLFHILKRMLSQSELDAKYYLKDVDSYTIWNTSSMSDLESEVMRLIEALGEKK